MSAYSRYFCTYTSLLLLLFPYLYLKHMSNVFVDSVQLLLLPELGNIKLSLIQA